MINKLKIKNYLKSHYLFHLIKKTYLYKILRESLKRPRLVVFISTKCNLACTYCTNDNPEKLRDKKISTIPYTEWAKALNIVGKKREIIFTGGEPTLYPDLVKLINSINKKIPILIFTNLIWSQEILDDFVKNLKRPIKFFASYHISSGNPERVINTAKILENQGIFNGIIHTVQTKNNKEFLKKVSEEFKKDNLRLIVDENFYECKDFEQRYEGCMRKFKKSAICKGNMYLINEDGNVYICLGKLLRRVAPLKNIFNDPLLLDKKFKYYCNEYGYCSICDLTRFSTKIYLVQKNEKHRETPE